MESEERRDDDEPSPGPKPASSAGHEANASTSTLSDDGLTELDDTLQADRSSSGDETRRSDGDGRTDSTTLAVDELGDLPVVAREFYEIGEEFARGGIGRITRARDRRLDRIVALKELRRNSRYAQLRFAREVRITARLQHPNIIPVHEAGRWTTGEPFFAMKLVDGGSLEDAIEACSSLPERLVLVRHVAAVAEAMGYAHTRQTVHRDLKPSNVLLGPFGETVVIDWGLAKDLTDPEGDELPAPVSKDAVDTYQTTDGVVLGTPPFMPPEQAQGKPVDERADVYALGAILYHVLTGRVPYFEYHPRDIVSKVVARPPTPLLRLEPDAPPDLVAIVQKAMARGPAERYRTAAAMAEELETFLTGGLVTAYQYSAAELLRRFVDRQRTAVTTGVFALVALALVAAWSFVNIAEQRNRAEDARAKAERLAELESDARQEALRRLDQSILNGARSAVGLDPTYALGLLKRLGQPIPGASTVAADAVERGVARHILAGHSDRIDALSFAPDGQSIVTSGWDGRVRAWTADGKAGPIFEEHGERVPIVAHSPDGALLAGAGYDDLVWLHDLRSGAATKLEGHTAPIRGLAWSPEGERLATVGEDGVRLWSIPEGEGRALEAPADRPLFATFSPDGRRLLTGSHRGALRLWSKGEGAADFDETPRILPHQAEVKTAAFSPDGRWIASGGGDAKLRIWSVDGKDERAFDIHEDGVEVVAWTPDGGQVISGGMDGELRSTSPSGRSRLLARHRERVSALGLSSDGRWVASGSWDRTIVLYDRRAGTTQRLLGHRGVVSGLAFSPHGQTLASVSWDRTFRIWPVEDGPRRTLNAHAIGVKAVDFSPDGRLLASGGHDDQIRIWDVDNGSLTATFIGHTDHVFRVIFSPDGAWVASSSDDRTVRLWRPDGSESQILEGHQADVEELAFSPDSELLVSGGEDSAVGLWRVGEGEGELLRGHEGPVLDVDFSPDGERMASASRDHTVRLWSRQGEEIATLTGHTADVTSLAFSPRGDALASTSKDGVRVWAIPDGRSRLIAGTEGAERVQFAPSGERMAVATSSDIVWICDLSGAPCLPLRGHSTKVNALVFNPDGSCLVSASGDGTLRIWDVATGESRPLRGHGAPVFDVAVSPDGQLIASASGDTTIRLWPLEKPPPSETLDTWLEEATSYIAPDLEVGPAAP